MQVRPNVKRVVGLTGTPSGNGLMDLFAEYKVLDMGERLGRFISQYRVEYFVPDQVNGPIVYSYRLRKLTEYKQQESIEVKYFDHETVTQKLTQMYVEGFKAKLEKDTSYKGLWAVSFSLKKFKKLRKGRPIYVIMALPCERENRELSVADFLLI